MYCPLCGKEVKPDWKFCPGCQYQLGKLKSKSRDIKVVKTESSTKDLSSCYENSYAVVIGINDYRKVNPLEC
ncbi:MAG: zinc-ribbon domain-containing protein, partial [Halanaerobium sp.]